MKHVASARRGRSRGNGKRFPSGKNQTFESNGPDVKIRGTAQQVHEKYLSLARDAMSAGDRISAEGFFQYADHYFRLFTVDPPSSNNGSGNGSGNGRNPQQRGSSATSFVADPAFAEGPQPDAKEVSSDTDADDKASAESAEDDRETV